MTALFVMINGFVIAKTHRGMPIPTGGRRNSAAQRRLKRHLFLEMNRDTSHCVVASIVRTHMQGINKWMQATHIPQSRLSVPSTYISAFPSYPASASSLEAGAQPSSHTHKSIYICICVHTYQHM